MEKNLKTLNCTLIQFSILWQQPNSNLAKLEEQFKTIKNTDLIILPELFNTGFCFDTHLAETMNGSTLLWLQKVAKQKKCAIMGSIMITEKNKIYNRLILVSFTGETQYYDKRHLFAYGNENKHFTEGTKSIIFELNGWKIKPIICYDLRFPVTIRNTENYDLLVCVANWPNVRIDAWNTLLKARAIENQSYVIGVNRVGTDANKLKYDGHSNAYDPLGKQLSNPSKTTTVLNVSIKKETITNIRKKLPFLNDRDSFELT